MMTPLLTCLPPEANHTQSTVSVSGGFTRIFITLCSFILLLNACTTLPTQRSTPPDIQQWQQQQQRLLALTQWQFSGKVAMRNGNDGGQADVFWKQTDIQHYEIKLVAPFGAGSSVLTANADQVMLAFSNGDGVVANSIDEILAEMPDWPFPVSGLRYWLLGTASPLSEASQLRWHESGGLAFLTQDGWDIELESYAQQGDYFLPHKITLRRQQPSDISVKLLVRQWLLP